MAEEKENKKSKKKLSPEEKLRQTRESLKEIKTKITSGDVVPDDEIAGKPKYKGKSPDLIPLSSIFDEMEESPLSKKISTHLNSFSESYERDDRYERFKTAMKTPEMSGCLDIYASEVITQNTEGKIFNIFCSSEKVTKILEELFRRLMLEDKSFDIVRDFCAYGDSFYEIIFSKDGSGIHSINPIPKELIGRKEINGVLQNFYIRKSKKMKSSEDSTYSFDYSYKSTSDNTMDKIDPIRILHWKIPSTEYAPYGKSVLDSVIIPLEELRLMEQSLLIARITRAPERRVYYVNVGNAQGEKGIAMAREVISRIKRKNILDKIEKNMDSNVDFFGSIEDVAIPFRAGEEKSTIESLPQLNDPGALTDLEFIRDRIFPGLGVPRTYLFDDTFANSNSALSNKSVSFAKRMRRIQKYFLYNVYKMAYIELKLKGIKDKEFDDLNITMNNPSNVDEREKNEIDTLKWTLISTIKSMNTEKVFFPDFYIYKEILNMSNEEMLQMMIQNLAQEGMKNPFAMLPEDQRPKDYLILDQLRTQEGGGEALTDENGDGIPDEANAAFGAPPQTPQEGLPPEEGAPQETAPPEEGAPENISPETAGLIYRDKRNKEMLLESLERAKQFKERTKQKTKPKTVEPKQTNFPVYSESVLTDGNEFVGINKIKKVIY